MLETITAFFDLNPASYLYSQWLFLRLLGLVYLVAFLSLSVQIRGLWGSQGILPFANRFAHLKRLKLSWRGVYYFPSLFWINTSNATLLGIGFLGIVASLALIFNIFPIIALIVLWITWQSFLTVDTVFMRLQSDSLLAETGFFAIFFALLTPPPLLALLCLWFLFFRFVFMAGIVKVLSGDRHWRYGTALQIHFETQPLPNPLSWYAHRLPRNILRFLAYSTIIVEVVIPFFIILPAPFRLAVFILSVMLQLGIIATGNYSFLNWIACLLAVPLLHNQYIQPWLGPLVTIQPTPHNDTLYFLVSIVSVAFVFLGALHIVRLWVRRGRIFNIFNHIGHLHLSNSYGIFAVMTTVRREILIQGSVDGSEWIEYPFKWKPGDVTKNAPQMAPHHPRIEWQLWFAALGHYQDYPWILQMLNSLLEGSTAVTALFSNNPFPATPPKYVRALLYEYRFTDRKTKKETGRWWNKSWVRTYVDSVSLDSFQ
ncbi:lipase maturation factor family protein [Simkania negevensis]|uniref:Lipase maturation factor family protein n=1 Tax=Simkania negevensis TaxID=83561 RepID=A0ABS3APY1_9BACT|nr:lipase maturation factor family protein [Simkania negevensis]